MKLRHQIPCIALFYLATLLCSCKEQQKMTGIHPDTLNAQINRIAILYDTLGAPQPTDWRANHTDEKFLSFEDYKKSKPTSVSEGQNKIYIVPVGTFDSVRLKCLAITREYLEAFFGLETVLQPGVSDSIVPANSRRIFYEKEQLKTGFFLNTYLPANFPNDAVTYIAFTEKDLFPSEDWNFVFGQASLKKRVGVWSVNRFGYPEINKKEYRMFLFRCLKTATHETGHMFSLPHCVKYACIMNGVNSLEESDTRPVWFCHECLKKICWNFSMEPEAHLKRMSEFWKKQNENEISVFYDKNIDIIK